MATSTKYSLSGGGSLTPGMERGISQVTGIYTTLLDPFRNIAVGQRDIKPDFLEADAAKYVVAIGLAMRNHNPLVQEDLPICVNLVPQKTSREFEKLYVGNLTMHWVVWPLFV